MLQAESKKGLVGPKKFTLADFIRILEVTFSLLYVEARIRAL